MEVQKRSPGWLIQAEGGKPWPKWKAGRIRKHSAGWKAKNIGWGWKLAGAQELPLTDAVGCSSQALAGLHHPIVLAMGSWGLQQGHVNHRREMVLSQLRCFWLQGWVLCDWLVLRRRGWVGVKTRRLAIITKSSLFWAHCWGGCGLAFRADCCRGYGWEFCCQCPFE